jgi:tripartite-type tricarboxylate transporter receptor subunit TctC
MFASRRSVLTQVLRPLAALALVVSCGLAAAQATKPIKLMVGFPPGGGTDAVARTLAEKLKDELGVAVVVENKPGAGGQLAAQALKASPADGTVLFLSHDHTISILPLVVKNPGFDSAQDFVPVAGFATFVNAFAVSGAHRPSRSTSMWPGSKRKLAAKAQWASLHLLPLPSFWSKWWVRNTNSTWSLPPTVAARP